MSWSLSARGSKEEVAQAVQAHVFPLFSEPEETVQAEQARATILAQIERMPPMPTSHEVKAYAHGSLYFYTGTDGWAYGHSNLKIEVEPVVKADAK